MPAPAQSPGDRYRWVALANTTAAMFMATLDGSIVIIALPAIFRGIHLDPLAAGNISYLLWMIMGYRLVQAVLVVSLGRLGDMFGRVKIYNAGFAVFTAASVLLSFDPFQGGHGALWLIGWRVLQAVGASMLMANSAAILTDAFPADRRGFALGTNQVAGLASSSAWSPADCWPRSTGAPCLDAAFRGHGLPVVPSTSRAARPGAPRSAGPRSPRRRTGPKSSRPWTSSPATSSSPSRRGARSTARLWIRCCATAASPRSC
jgi:MFS family permease